MKSFSSTLLIAIIGGITTLGLNHLIQNHDYVGHSQLIHPASSMPVKYVNMPNSSPENQVDFTGAAEMSVHSVVNVTTTYSLKKNRYVYDPFHGIFGLGTPEQSEAQMASGSGVIISQDGYIVTNNHVVDQGEKIEITLNDKRTYNAKVIGKDAATDLALLKIDEKNLSFMTYGNSDNVKVGEWVLAVGNPFNLTSTVTAGIISAKARNINILENDPNNTVHSIESYLQTDAAVNPGNSGGALVSTKGELIGINSAIASNTGSYTGYSFAIPVNIARKVMADLLEFGEVQRAFIGVSIRDLDAKLAKEKNISEIKGVYVEGLAEGGSGEEAGIMSGDIITKIGETAVNNVPELQEQVSRYRPGDKIKVNIKRADQQKEFTLVLKNRNGNTDIVKQPESEIFSTLGASFEPISNSEMKKMGIRNGLRVSQLNAGKLLNAGVMEGFVIINVDKIKISSVEDLKRILENKKGGVLIEGIYPNGLRAYYGFGI